MPHGNIDQNTLLLDIATRNVASFGLDARALDAAKLMAERRISSVVVVDGDGHPAGIVTERNILRAVHSGTRREGMLRDIMSAPVVTVPSSVTAFEAYRLCLLRGIRHMVIVDADGRLAGVASETDFRQHLNLSALAGRRKIGAVAGRSTLSLPPGASLDQALGMMAEQCKSCVVVIEGKKPVGIVTERDVVRFYSEGEKGEHVTVGQVMAAPVLTVHGDASCSRAAELMLDHKVRHLVVVDESGDMAGLVNEHDLTQAMAAGMSEERGGLEDNFLRTLINTLPDLVWLKNTEGVYLACNSRFERFFGAREQDIVGKTDYDFTSREEAEFFRAHDRMAMEAGGPTVNEEWITFADDGHREFLETIKTPMRDRDGKLVGVLGIARDITARKQLEKNLERNEDALRFIAQRNAAENPESILAGLAQYLGKTLAVDYVLIDRLAEEEGVAETVALYVKGGIVPNMRYALKDTPCDNVIGKELCCYAENIQARFPRDVLLGELGAESYAGIPLWDSAGKPIGLIAVLDGKPFRDEESVTSLLKLMAARAGSELERARSEQLLRVREREFRTLAESAPVNIVRYDRDCRVVYINPSMLRALDMTLEQVLGKTPTEAIPGKTAETYEAVLGQVIRSNTRQRLSYSWPEEGENPRYVNVYFVPETGKDGEVTGALAMGSDVTELKKAELSLRQVLEFTEGVINAIPDLLFELDRDGRYLNIWAHDDALLASQKELLLGHSVREVLPAEAAAIVMAAIGEAAVKGSSSGQVIQLDLPQGKRWFELSAAAKPVDGAKARHFMMLSRDITDRIRAEAELYDSHAKLSGLYSLSPMGIALTDMQGHYVEFNEAFRDICGYTRDELNRLDYWELTPREYAAKEAEQLESLNTRGYYGPYEKEYIRKDGSRIPLRLNGVLIHGSDGKPYIWSIVEDITESKRAEEALSGSERRYRSLVENSPFCIHEIDTEGRLLSMNSAGLCMLKLDDEAQVRGEPYLGAVSEQDYERIDGLLRDAFDGKSSHFEFMSSGSAPLYFKSCFIPIRDAGGKVVKLMGITEDITERKRAEQQREHNLSLLNATLESSADAILVVDLDSKWVLHNQRFLELWGIPQGIAESGNDGAALSYVRGRLQDPESFLKKVQELYATPEASSFDTFSFKDGRSIERYSIPQRIAGKVVGRVWSFRDVTERKRAEDALRITSSVFETTQEAILITDADNFIMDANQAFTRITGYSREEVLGKNPRMLSSGRHSREFYAAMWDSIRRKKSWRGEIWNRRKNGETYAELLSISAICGPDGKVQRHVGVFSDISYLKEHEAELNRAAYYDALTGIPNRLLLADRMKQAIAQTSRDRNMMAVCYLDLDGFKQVNDTMGHEAGDQVLVEMARRIGHTIRGGDTVARLGGDEFVMLLLGLEQGDECMATLERLLKAIGQPMEIGGKPVTLGASIGVSIYPLDDEDPDTLLRHADQAMYISKQSGKNRYHVYDPALDLRARSHYEFIKSIQDGLAQGQFELYYQPKIDLNSGEVVGAEALIRWRHVERGLLLPADFLPTIEDTELGIDLGEWVIGAALEQMERWRGEGLDIEVSVNISAHHLESHQFVERLRQQLARHPRVPKGRLQIEVLETVALEDIVIVREIIESCRKLGVSFALDDFGTGYSSLSYLSSLPVDALKIDQSFVRDMLEDKGALAIVQGVIALARAFGREIVAEGIETEDHYRALLEMGCRVGQGFGIARPMPADEFLNWRARR